MAYSFEKNEFSCLFLHMIELFQQNCPLNSHLRLIHKGLRQHRFNTSRNIISTIVAGRYNRN